MAFNTYDELVDAIVDQLARRDLTEVVPRWIRLVEAELSRDLDIREVGKEFSGTSPGSGDTLTLPDDCLWVRHLRIDTDPIRFIEIVSLVQLAAVRQNSKGANYPVAAAFVGENLTVAPAWSAATDYTLQYMAAITPLSAENESNTILERAPDCLFYGALLHSAPYIQDDARIATWAALYGNAKESYKKLEWRARAGGGPLRVRPDVVPAGVHNPTRPGPSSA